jgi:hypothetical protein
MIYAHFAIFKVAIQFLISVLLLVQVIWRKFE